MKVLFFSSILSSLTDPSDQNRLKEELAVLCNKAMVAESIDLFNIGEMERMVKKVFHCLNLGLQFLSREEKKKALQILQTVTLQKIFQSGVGAILLLKKRAETLLRDPWFGGDRENLSFFDPIHLEKFQGILRRRPGIYRNGILDDFRDLGDFKAMESFFDQIEVVVTTLREKLNTSPARLKGMDLSGCTPGSWRGLTFSTLFLTSLANGVLRGSFHVEPIEKQELKAVLSYLFERDENGKGRVSMELKHRLREWVDSTEKDEQKRHHLLAFWDFCCDLLEEEYGNIASAEEIDLRFVKGLMIRQ